MWLWDQTLNWLFCPHHYRCCLVTVLFHFLVILCALPHELSSSGRRCDPLRKEQIVCFCDVLKCDVNLILIEFKPQNMLLKPSKLVKQDPENLAQVFWFKRLRTSHFCVCIVYIYIYMCMDITLSNISEVIRAERAEWKVCLILPPVLSCFLPTVINSWKPALLR